MLLGKPVQEAILEDVRGGLAELAATGQRPPKLAAVLVGDDAASAMYVRTKTRTCKELGIDSEAILLPGDPLRAAHIAGTFFDDAVEVTSVRNMLGFTGT